LSLLLAQSFFKQQVPRETRLRITSWRSCSCRWTTKRDPAGSRDGPRSWLFHFVTAPARLNRKACGLFCPVLLGLTRGSRIGMSWLRSAAHPPTPIRDLLTAMSGDILGQGFYARGHHTLLCYL